MTRYLIAKLGDVCRFVSGGTPSRKVEAYFKGNIPWITGADVEDLKVQNVRSFITKEAIENSATNIVCKGTVLLVTRTGVGKVAITDRDLCFSQDLTGIFPDQRQLLPAYLARFLLYSGNYFKSLQRGATIQGISRDILAGLKIPLPPLPIQKKIATILEKADQARCKRQETLRLTDQFLQTAFIQMFGDPGRNPKNWKMTTIGEEIINIRYGTGSPPPYVQKGIPFIMATNIKSGTVQDSDIRYISSKSAAGIKKCQVNAGDLIIVRSGVNAGDCGLIPLRYAGAYAAYDLIVELSYPNAVYYNHLINSVFGKALILPLKRRAGQPHLNADQVCSLKFPSPQLTEKEKFVSIVEKVGAFREIQIKNEQELNLFFKSLMQKAFNGDLVN